MKIRDKILLISLIIFTILSRFLFLGSWPKSFNKDEAMNGYQAYSILKTGRDIHGRHFPFLYMLNCSRQKAISDIVYPYSTIPSVALFGLNEFAVRLPAATFGTLSILLLYLLTKEISKNETISLLSAFFLAISPWHILLSRIGFSPISLLPIFFLSFFLLFRGMRKEKFLIPISAVFFALTFYSYRVAFVFTPTFLLLFLLCYWDEVKKERVFFILFSIVLLIGILPISVFYLKNFYLASNYSLVRAIPTSPFLLPYEKILLFLFNLSLYLSSRFTLRYFYLPVFLSLVWGMEILWRERGKNKTSRFLIYSLLASFLISALSFESPHLTRSIGCLFFSPVVAAIGLYHIYHSLKQCECNKRKLLKLLAGTTLVVLFVANTFYLSATHYPYNLMPISYPIYQCCYKDVVEYIKKNQNQYSKIIFTNKKELPFIYFLFYLKYDPKKFQSEKKKIVISHGWDNIVAFDKYRFCNPNNCYSPDKNYLYVVTGNELSGFKPDRTFHNLDGSSFRIITNKDNEE